MNEITKMDDIITTNQRSSLTRFKLSEYHHYNNILNIFNDNQEPKTIINNIFWNYHNIVKNNNNLTIENIITFNGMFYSYDGCYFTLQYLDNEYSVMLGIEHLTYKTGNRGLLEHYLKLSDDYNYNSKRVNSWDELFKLITGYSGELPHHPIISSTTLLTLINSIPDTVNNGRPTFINAHTLNNQYSKISGELLTISGLKKFTIKNIIDTSTHIISSIHVSIEGMEDTVHLSPMSALTNIEKPYSLNLRHCE